jgi:hypothetical protein
MWGISLIGEMSEIEKWDKAKAALQSAIINSLVGSAVIT